MSQNPSEIISNDGQALLFFSFLNDEQKVFYFNELFNKIDWFNDEIMIFGKTIITKRKVAFYADEGIEYTYSKKTKKGTKWIPVLLELKEMIESITRSRYNACLLNLYHDGMEGMGWHADDEKEIIENSSIASLSFGAERNFVFKHKTTKEKVNLILNNGSLLEMKGAIQKCWLHALPKSKKITNPRINLTFRNMHP